MAAARSAPIIGGPYRWRVPVIGEWLSTIPAVSAPVAGVSVIAVQADAAEAALAQDPARAKAPLRAIRSSAPR
jgi:hypothetical protein